MAIDYVTETVNLTVEGRVATIEMNRPESLNSLNVDMIKGLASVMKEVSNTEEIDIVVLKGAGRAFSSGGDIKTMLLEANESDFPLVMDAINEMVVTLYSMPKLTISAVKGAAAGLGFSLALATDYVLADKQSKLAMNFIGIGLIPDGGSHFFLESKLGEDKAKQLIWEGRPMKAEEALQKGLVHEVAEGDLDEALQVKLQAWLNSPVQAMIKTKKILADKNRPLLLKVLELEKLGQAQMRRTADHKEGIDAFIQKRKPVFKGE
ncbi:enoyl-CoA hydratase [Cytobacillus purgationiresistens]|uniref:Enoyl-CoA hydratase/carnithine racemase n=1 Tax=Cytobacillus purgationiresistens TaxID=863449 RepID=A0ABU0ACI0_9BACI|nr:enoyl-CoA hydratase [Cytobacillus purgationiresistens]MDQ0268958.1 enoyl-CoA hydratase/carnithine racemase [Cytobacillus purgationiresistens]